MHNAFFMTPRPLLLGGLLVALVATAAATTPPTEGPVTKLAPFRVKDEAINSFGFDLKIYHDKQTKKVLRIFFGEIKSGSSAAALDIEPGDEIAKINGRPVSDFPAAIGVDSDLGKLFLARPPGDTLDLEIIRHRRETVTVKALPVTRFGR